MNKALRSKAHHKVKAKGERQPDQTSGEGKGDADREA